MWKPEGIDLASASWCVWAGVAALAGPVGQCLLLLWAVRLWVFKQGLGFQAEAFQHVMLGFRV